MLGSEYARLDSSNTFRSSENFFQNISARHVFCTSDPTKKTDITPIDERGALSLLQNIAAYTYQLEGRSCAGLGIDKKGNDLSGPAKDFSLRTFHRNARYRTKKERFCLTIMQSWRTCGLRYGNLLLRERMHSSTKKRKNSRQSVDVSMFDATRGCVCAILVAFGIWMFLRSSDFGQKERRQTSQEACPGASFFYKRGPEAGSISSRQHGPVVRKNDLGQGRRRSWRS